MLQMILQTFNVFCIEIGRVGHCLVEEVFYSSIIMYNTMNEIEQ